MQTNARRTRMEIQADAMLKAQSVKIHSEVSNVFVKLDLNLSMEVRTSAEV